MQNHFEHLIDYFFKVLKVSLLIIPFGIFAIFCFYLMQFFTFLSDREEIQSYNYINLSTIENKDSTVTYLINKSLKNNKISEREYENIYRYLSKKKVIELYNLKSKITKDSLNIKKGIEK